MKKLLWDVSSELWKCKKTFKRCLREGLKMGKEVTKVNWQLTHMRK